MINNSCRPYKNLPVYNPKIKDSFYDYKFEGYTDFAPKINFGTEKKPIVSEIYYAPIIMNSFGADAFFVVHKFDSEPFFQLYYGNKKADIDIDLD